MSRSLVDCLKAMWHSVTKAVVPEESNQLRITSARMSNTRLKALDRPDYLPPETPEAAAQPLEPEISGLPSLGDAEVVVGGHKPINKPSLAKVSHYRLAAYVASLPEEEQEKSKKELEEFCQQ